MTIGQTKMCYLKIASIISDKVSGSLKGKFLNYGGDVNYKNNKIRVVLVKSF